MRSFKLLNSYFNDNTTETKVLLPKPHANILYYYSYLWFINAIYGAYMNHYTNSLIPFGVGCTSLLYWNMPTHGWRRRLDMSMCLFSSVYVTYQLLDSIFWTPYIIIKAFGYLSYFLSSYVYTKNKLELSTVLHMYVHLSAHFGCIILFNNIRSNSKI
jgi:hypothetical protein